MFFRIFVAHIFLANSICSFSQAVSFTSVSGIVVDVNQSSIPYVNVRSKNDPSLGITSNANGEFRIYLPPSNRSDSLIFSCIGYEDFFLPLKNLRDSSFLSIVLKTKLYFLNEVIVSPDSAEIVVKSAVKRLESNLASEKNILQGFYREIIRSDRTYDRLIEAAIDVFDNGYHSNKSDKLQFKVREIRKSDDFRDMDWKQAVFNYINPKNSLHGSHESLFNNDYIRNNNAAYSIMVNGPLNSQQFYDEVILTLDSATYYNSDKVLCVGIHPRNGSWAFLPFGVIHIRAKDYAILQIEYGAKVNPEVPVPFAVPGQEYMHKTLIKYKDYNGAMYLDFIFRQSFRFELNETKFIKSKNKNSGVMEGFFYQECLFATNEIITERNKLYRFKRKERQNKNIDLYGEVGKYNEGFWKSFNAVNERPLEPLVKKDIERERALNEQFKKND